MIRIALRNLARNRWRTGLTLSGVAVAVGSLVWMSGMVEAFLDVMEKSTTATLLGEVRIETEEYARQPSLYEALPVTPELLANVRAAPGVRAVAPRLETFGLLGYESRSQAALVLGVDPTAEVAASDVASSIVSGAWLSAKGAGAANGPTEIVLGEVLARLLMAKVGDEVVALVQAADGTTGDDRLRVVGIARTTSTALSRGAAWVPLEEVGVLGGLEGRAHQLIVRTERGADAQEVAAQLREVVAPAPGPKLAVRTWREIVPDMSQMIELSRLAMWFLYGIVFFIAALGILNTQRMTALERKRELAVMMAVGVTPGKLSGLVVLESTLLTAIGAVIGALLGWALAAYHAHAGVDMTLVGSQGFSFQGITFGPRLYFVLRPEMVIQPALAVLVVGALCGLWPAVASARLELSRAIAGRT